MSGLKHTQMQIYFLKYLSEPIGASFPPTPYFSTLFTPNLCFICRIMALIEFAAEMLPNVFQTFGIKNWRRRRRRMDWAHTEGRNKKNNKRNPNTGDRRSSAFRGGRELWGMFSHHLLKLPFRFWTRPAVPSPAGWWAAMSPRNLLHLGSKS